MGVENDLERYHWFRSEYCCNPKKKLKRGKDIQVQALAAKTDDLSLIFGTHMMKGEN